MRVIVLVHSDLIPPEEVANPSDIEFKPWVTEFDVIQELKNSGHVVRVVGLDSNLDVLRREIFEFQPNIVFNLLEEFDGEVLFDQNVVSYLELKRIDYTGCNPRGLMLSRDKALAKKVLSFHRLQTPHFQVFLKKRRTKIEKKLKYPLIVKCLHEEASYGLTKDSIVNNEQKLRERIEYIHENLNQDAIVEEFVEGREYFVGILGNQKLEVLPIWELHFSKSETPEKEFYTEKAKWSEKYRSKKGIKTQKAELPSELEKKIIKTCKRAYKALEINGYARIDLRVSVDGEIYIIEANPNPNIARLDDFAQSANAKKISYSKLIEKILNLGKS